MKTTVIKEVGFDEALFGLGLSYGLTSESDDYYMLDQDTWDAHARLSRLANKLCNRDGGHNKFLESIVVWLDIDAPRYWWSEFDTYRVGTTKQSESTMHTLKKRDLVKEDFEGFISDTMLQEFNEARRAGYTIDALKGLLPEGFLQRRIVCTNYKCLRNIVWQREGHKLPQWRSFCSDLLQQLQHPQFIKGDTSHE